MIKTWVKIFLLCLFCPSLWGQGVTVTASVVDGDGQQWIGGNYSVSLVLPSGITHYYDTRTGLPFTSTFQGGLDGTGSLSLSLIPTNFISPAGSQWKFYICPQVLGAGCGTVTLPITSGGSISSQINAVIPVPRVTGGPGVYAYNDLEVAAFAPNTYFNVISQQNRCYATSWTVCNIPGGGATLPTNAIVYGLSPLTSRAAVPGTDFLAPGLLPNGTTGFTQSLGDNTTKLATDAFVLANVASPTQPAGSNTQLQFNNTGIFGADATLTFNTSTKTLFEQNDTLSPLGTAISGTNFNSGTLGLTASYFNGSALPDSWSFQNILSGTVGNPVSTLTISHTSASTGGAQFILPNNTLATTQSPGDNSTKVATTAYADAGNALPAGVGIVKITNGTKSLAVPQTDYNVPSAGFYYQSNFPSSCTVSAVAYTTQPDCAFYTAKAYTVATNIQTSLYLSSGTQNTVASFVEPTGLYSVNIHGNGIQGTTLAYTGGSAIPVISRATGGANWSPLQITDMLIDGGATASAIIDTAKLGQPYFNNLEGQNIARGSDHMFEFSHTGSDYSFQVWASNIIGSGENQVSGRPIITCTPVAGACTSWTISSGGAGVSSTDFNEIIVGYQGGTSYKACATLPAVPTLTISGGVITAVTPTGSNGSGCTGTINLLVSNIFPMNYGIYSLDSDSHFEHITMYVGKQAAFYFGGGENTLIHMHPAEVPYGVINLGGNRFVGTECDNYVAICMKFGQFGANLLSSVVGTVAYGSWPGSSVYYFGDPTTGLVNFGQDANLCAGTVPTDFHPYVGQNGPFDQGGAIPTGVSISGGDRACANNSPDMVTNPTAGPALWLAPSPNPLAYLAVGRENTTGQPDAMFGQQSTFPVSAAIQAQAGTGIAFNISNTFGSGQVGGYSPTGVPLLVSAGSIASATTIAPGAAQGGAYHITGTTPISTITPPTNCSTAPYICTYKFFSDNGFSTVTGGNISVAFTTTAGHVYEFTHDQSTSLWYPTD